MYIIGFLAYEHRKYSFKYDSLNVLYLQVHKFGVWNLQGADEWNLVKLCDS